MTPEEPSGLFDKAILMVMNREGSSFSLQRGEFSTKRSIITRWRPQARTLISATLSTLLSS